MSGKRGGVGGLGLALCAASIMSTSSQAIDSGRIEGSLSVDGETLELNHSYVLLHDNAEGLLGSTPELRICLTDREIDNEALRGVAFLPVEHMARRGEVRGILMTVDPARPNEVSTTLLFPAEPGHALMATTLADKELWIELGVGDLRVVGHMPDLSEAEVALGWIDPGLRFDAPLFREREITADLEGKEALASPPVEALRDRTAAMARGDIEAVRGLSTTESVGRMEAFQKAQGLDESSLKEMMKGAGEMGYAVLEMIRRVVVREDHAVVIFETGDDTKQWATLHKVDGVWKSAD